MIGVTRTAARTTLARAPRPAGFARASTRTVARAPARCLGIAVRAAVVTRSRPLAGLAAALVATATTGIVTCAYKQYPFPEARQLELTGRVDAWLAAARQAGGKASPLHFEVSYW